MKKNCASKCIKKRSFNNKEEALEELLWLRLDKKNYGKLRGVYRCTLCKKYHLTKNDNAQFVINKIKGKWELERTGEV